MLHDQCGPGLIRAGEAFLFLCSDRGPPSRGYDLSKGLLLTQPKEGIGPLFILRRSRLDLLNRYSGPGAWQLLQSRL